MVLKTTAASGALGSARPRDSLLGPRVAALDGGGLGRRGKLLDEEVQQAAGRRCRAWRRPPSTGTRVPGADRLAEGGQHLLLLDAAVFEILGEEVVVRLGHRLHELLAPGLGVVHDVAGDIGLLDLAVHGEERLHGDEVDHALEARLRPDRHLERAEPALEALLERLERAVEVGALAVEPVDDDGARQAVLVGVLPDLLGLHLHPGDGVDDDHGRGRHAEPRACVGHEIAVPRGVDQVEVVALPVAVGDRRAERDLSLDLVGIEVGGGGAVVDLARAGSWRRPRTEWLPPGMSCRLRRDPRSRRCGSWKCPSPCLPPRAALRRETPTAGERAMWGGMLPQCYGVFQRSGIRRCRPHAAGPHSVRHRLPCRPREARPSRARRRERGECGGHFEAPAVK